MSYGELIMDAFWTILRNCYLWFFGFFVGGAFGANFPSGGGNFNGEDLNRSSIPFFGSQISGGETALIVGLVVLALLIIGLVLFLPTIILATQDFSTAAIVTGIIILPIITVASAALGTFFHSYWTLAYLRISSPEDQEASQAEVTV